MTRIEKADSPIDYCSPTYPAYGGTLGGFWGGWFLLCEGSIRGEFSDKVSRACSIEENLETNVPSVLLGPNYQWVSGTLHTLDRMILDQEGAKQLVAALNHFIEHGHLKQILPIHQRLAKVLRQWWGSKS